MKRADSKRGQGNGTATSAAALSHGPANGTRHRRLASSRHKPSKAGRSAGVLRRLVPVAGLAFVGLVGTLMVLSVSRLDAGFSYNSDGGSLRGVRDHYQVHKPLPLQPPSPLPRPPPPPPPPKSQELEKKDGGDQAAAAATHTTLHPKLVPQPPPGANGDAAAAGAGGRIGDGGGQGSGGSRSFDWGKAPEERLRAAKDEADRIARREMRERARERSGRTKKSFSRIGDNDHITSEAGIRKGYIQGQWKGGHLGENIETDIEDNSWNIAPGAPGSNVVSAAAADFGKRPVIINADQDQQASKGGGGPVVGEGLGGGSAAMRWMPGQLTRLAEMQQQLRDEEDEEESGTVSRTRMLGADAALLIICANRPEYLERTLNAVSEYHPGSSRGAEAAIPVVISQDGSSQKVEEIISRFKLSMAGRAHVIHVHHTPPPREMRPYFKLSAHYKWALTQAFDEIDSGTYGWAVKDKVIILEEDLEIAPDFFEYFSAMAPLLDSDDTLMAVSAWNDNGQAVHVKDNKALFRSDFFPGLGWMLPRRVWEELSPTWPDAYWDDWLRDPKRRRNRQFIRPEVCRTYHFGQKAGASKNQFGALLDNIKLNKEAVLFREMDVSYLEPEAFRSRLGRILRDAPVESIASVQNGRSRYLPSGVVVEYGSEREYEALAKQLGIMQDTKAGIPRTAYMGVVSLWVGDTKVYLAPRGVSHQMLS